MKKIILILSWLFIFNTVNAAELNDKDVEKFINDMSKTSQSILNNKSLSEKQRKKDYKDFSDKIVDSEWVAKFVLGNYWRQINQKQQEEFLVLYRDYLLDNYMPKLEDYNKDINIQKIVKTKQYVFMVTTKTRDKTDRDINVDFRLVEKDGKLFITDIIPEGISFIGNQRSDVGSSISNSGYDAFIKELRSKISK
ncbi:MAG TPA: ABC transporter substrate-binding protein [Rickettsiales bacterium]|nr:ABC transporter substrate-binding protein [Rickettsiales bacterium]